MAYEQAVAELYNRWQSTVDDLVTYNDAYEGELLPENLGMSLPPELRRLHTVANWNRLVVDTIEERLDITGFRLAGQSESYDRLWRWWKANHLDEASSFAHLDALTYGRAFICVGKRAEGEGDPDIPLITVESPENVFVRSDPRTRQVIDGVRFYERDPTRAMWTGATYYTATAIHYYRYDGGGWTEVDRTPHDLGTPPIVPVLNRARISDRLGRSEMTDIMPLTSATCRALTNLQGAQELMAVPQRYIMGLSEKDFKNPDGSRKSPLEAYMARIWTMSNPDAKAGQFPAASLDNFATAINIGAKLASSLSGVPLRFFGVVSDVNPTSAEAVRADESRLVKRAERKQRLFAPAWERAMRLGLVLVGNPDGVDAARLETRWRDASTPTWAASAQAAVQLYQSGVIPRETAWSDLGYTPEQQTIMAQQLSDDPLARLLATVGEDGTNADTVPGAAGSGLTYNSIGGAVATASDREPG